MEFLTTQELEQMTLQKLIAYKSFTKAIEPSKDLPEVDNWKWIN
jgi:hypothetical protein